MKRLLAIAVLVAGCGGPSTAPSIGPSVIPSLAVATPSPSAQPTVFVDPYVAITPAPTPEPTPNAIGDRMGFGSSSGSEIYVTIKAVKPFSEKYNDPPTGMKYVIVDIALEGTSGETTVSAFDFTVTDADAYIYEITGMFKEPALPYDNTLTAGKKVRGWLTFEVPKAMKAGWVVFADSTVAFRLP